MPAKKCPKTSTGVEFDRRYSAFYDRYAQLRLWVITAGALAADLWTKNWAFETLGPRDMHEAIPHVLTFRRSLNAGALFGLGQGMVPVFIGASLLALGFVLYYFRCSDRRQWILHLALSFVLAGSLGNLHDRVLIQADRITINTADGTGVQTRIVCILDDDGSSEFLRYGFAPEGSEPRRIARSRVIAHERVGVVRDFLKFEPRLFGRDVWPWVFNVADSLLTVGVIMLLIHLWVEQKRTPVSQDVRDQDNQK